jgi:hypothetical protein
MLQITPNDQVFSSHLSRKGERGDGESHSYVGTNTQHVFCYSSIPIGLLRRQRVLNRLWLSLGLSRKVVAVVGVEPIKTLRSADFESTVFTISPHGHKGWHTLTGVPAVLTARMVLNYCLLR